MFFDASLAKTVRQKFGKESEIQLEDFIQPEKLKKLREELMARWVTDRWLGSNCGYADTNDVSCKLGDLHFIFIIRTSFFRQSLQKR